MKIAKNQIIFVAFWGSLLGGILILSLTERASLQAQNNHQPAVLSETATAVSYQAYVQQVRPWLQAVTENYSPETITAVKNKLLTFQSPDSSLGQIHIQLFLAFSAWENFLTTDSDNLRTQTSQQLASLAKLLPDLSPEINNLQSILN